MRVAILFGLMIWIGLWPLTIICIVLQVLLAKTQDKRNGLYVPIAMYALTFLFSLSIASFSSDAQSSNILIDILMFLLALVSGAVVPFALWGLHRVLHKQYLRDRQSVSDDRRMKIKDL